jgi:hypothetical protein
MSAYIRALIFDFEQSMGASSVTANFGQSMLTGLSVMLAKRFFRKRFIKFHGLAQPNP